MYTGIKIHCIQVEEVSHYMIGLGMLYYAGSLSAVNLPLDVLYNEVRRYLL